MKLLVAFSWGATDNDIISYQPTECDSVHRVMQTSRKVPKSVVFGELIGAWSHTEQVADL